MKVIYCLDCGQIISAPKSGDKVFCHCGKSHIEKLKQTQFCHRYGGNVVAIEFSPGSVIEFADRMQNAPYTEEELSAYEETQWGAMPLRAWGRLCDRHEFARAKETDYKIRD